MNKKEAIVNTVLFYFSESRDARVASHPRCAHHSPDPVLALTDGSQSYAAIFVSFSIHTLLKQSTQIILHRFLGIHFLNRYLV